MNKKLGPKFKYGEKTQNITTRVPASKVAAFREHTKKWLKTYVIHKPNIKIKIMKNSKQLFNSLPENEQLLLIEKVMPMSGAYRQLEEKGSWSEGQWELLKDEFINSTHWEQGEELEAIDVHDKTYVINGESDSGNRYEAVGNYSDGELVSIEDLILESQVH